MGGTQGAQTMGIYGNVATFHINRNQSDIQKICTQMFFFGNKIWVLENIKNSFGPKLFLGRKFFRPKNIFYKKVILGPTFIGIQNFLQPS